LLGNCLRLGIRTRRFHDSRSGATLSNAVYYTAVLAARKCSARTFSFSAQMAFG
jgi:hypothetical protein